MNADGHDQRVDAWIAKLGGGDRQFFQRTRIPSHVAWRLANVLDAATVSLLDYVVTDGTLPNSVTGRVVIIAGRQIVDIAFTDSVEADFTASTGRLTMRSGATIESIEIGGTDAAHATGSSREPGVITVHFRDGSCLTLPLGKWERDTRSLMDAVRAAAGWP